MPHYIVTLGLLILALVAADILSLTGCALGLRALLLLVTIVLLIAMTMATTRA